MRAFLPLALSGGLLMGLAAGMPAAAADSVRATVAATDIDRDLAAADQPCAAVADMVQRTFCFNVRERVVWLKDSPESIDSFDLFSARRIQLINQLASGLIGWGEYTRGFNAAAHRLVVYKTLTAPR